MMAGHPGGRGTAVLAGRKTVKQWHIGSPSYLSCRALAQDATEAIAALLVVDVHWSILTRRVAQ